MKRPPIQPRSRLAHEAAKWAGDQGCFAEYNRALFRAFFEHGKNIGDLRILKELAADLQLDPKSLHAAIENGDYTEMVFSDKQKGEKIGVRAVPAFAANNMLLAAGVQSAERLRQLMSLAAKKM